MSNARDDKDRAQNSRKRRAEASVITPSEDIGLMHLSTENYSTAIEYFQKALDSADLKDFPDRFRLYLHIGDCHRHKGEYRQARVAFERARFLMGEDHDRDPAALGKVEYREGSLLLHEGDYEAALKQGFDAYRRLKRSDEHRDVAYVQLMIAAAYQRLGLTNEAEEFFMDALASFRRVDDRVGEAIVYNNLGLVHKNACRWNRALASLSKSLELTKSLGLTQHLVRVQLNLGVVYAKQRRYADALSVYSQAEQAAERFGDQFKLTKVLFMKGRNYIFTGQFCKAEKCILRAQAMANEYGYRREQALTDEFLGELMIARGRYEEAMVNLSKGLAIAKRIAPEGDIVAEILRRMADVHYCQNDIDKALETIDEGLRIAEQCGEYYELGFYHRTRALCHKRRGELPAAIASMIESVDTFTQRGNEYERHISQLALAKLYMRASDSEALLKARHLLAESVAAFSKIDESVEQLKALVLHAVVEERLGNLDDALLAVYEADRIADDEQNTKFKRLLNTMRERVEFRMTRNTTRVLEQIPMFGDDQSGLRSRNKMIDSLGSSLRFILQKSNADLGFVAIASSDGSGFEVVARDRISAASAKAIVAWYGSQGDAEHGLLFSDAEQLEGLSAVDGMGKVVFQSLGFENQELGLIFVAQDTATTQSPVGEEGLHFISAYSRLISLSVYELVRNERRREPKEKPESQGFSNIVTENTEMIKLLNLAERVASSNATVLLQGETGTGKGLIAYAVHLLSERRDKRFVHVNCAAMPESLLESELFGHSRGAFTGASHDKEGLLTEAHGGTIFLDEIAKTSLAMQGKLLQFLDTGHVRKVGSNEMRPVDVRVICASKGDLLGMCEVGTFLEDLFYRINDFPLTVPPLRRRPEDIELLFFHYLRKFTQEMGKEVNDVTDEAMAVLRDYHWAGNVRELEKVVKRAIILADDKDKLDLRHLPSEVVSPARTNGNGGGMPSKLRDKIEKLERGEIQAALERNGWNKSRVSADLGISYPSLLSKIKRYNIRSY